MSAIDKLKEGDCRDYCNHGSPRDIIDLIFIIKDAILELADEIEEQNGRVKVIKQRIMAIEHEHNPLKPQPASEIVDTIPIDYKKGEEVYRKIKGNPPSNQPVPPVPSPSPASRGWQPEAAQPVNAWTNMPDHLTLHREESECVTGEMVCPTCHYIHTVYKKAAHATQGEVNDD